MDFAPGFTQSRRFSMKRVAPRLSVLAVLCAVVGLAPGRSLAAGETRIVRSADGVEIAFSVEGTGKPALVFVHGWSCDRSYWRYQVSAFAKSYQVVTIDLAGHGDSGLNRDPWTVEAYGRDVTAVVGELGLQKVVLIGHSMGGAIIIEAAKLMPDRVVALVGVDTFHDLERAVDPQEAAQFTAGFKADFAVATRAFVKMMFPASADSALVASIAEDLSAAPPAVAVPTLESALTYQTKGALAGLKIPVFAINADLWPTNVEAGKREAYSFEVKLMPGRGHFVMMEDPESFNRLLVETLDEISKD
jgi:pimeloyl-ACP methyl ester carboxylesterase